MNIPRPELGIRPRLLFLALAPLLLVVTVIGYYMTTERIRDVQTALEDRGRTIALHLAPACEFGLFSNNAEMLQKLAEDSLQDQDIIYVGVIDSSETTVAAATRSLLADATDSWPGKRDETLEFTAPVYTTGIPQTEYDSALGLPGAAADSPEEHELLGRVIIRLSKQPTLLRQHQIIYNSLVLLGLGLIASTLLALRMVGHITRPVLDLSHMVDRLTHGDLGVRVRPGSVAELGKLEAGFNEMANRIEGGKARLENQIRIATTELQNTVNALQQRNTELTEARQVAIRAGEAKAEFLARMSHEIRTPLNAVIGYAGLLQDQHCADSRDEYVKTINKAAGQLLSVIDSVLNFSRLESGAVELEHEPFSLREALEDTVIMLGNAAHEKGLELVLLVDSDVPDRLRGDAMRISQIVTNLLANAIKFTERGHVVVRAGVTTDAEQVRRLGIAVSDTGIGIDTAQQQELFKPFAQVDSSVTRRFGGTGLGLIISRMLAKLMEGDILLESTPGQGSVFTLVFPCHADDEAVGQEKRPEITGKALVYDAHPLSRRATRNMLLSHGMEVYTSGTHADTLDILSGQPADAPGFRLLVLAAQQQEAESAAFRSLLDRALASVPVPVLVLTGSERWNNPYADDSRYCVEWLSKPVRLAALQARIMRMLGIGGSADARQGAARASAPAVPPDLRVLVVEDNRFNRRLVQELLGRLGVQCTLAESGAQALSRTDSNRYDLILMDIHMPEMDGIETTRRLRGAEGPNRSTPVIGLTADVFLDTGSRDTGIDDYVYKPVTIDKLAAAIDRWAGWTDSASPAPAHDPTARPAPPMAPLPSALAGSLLEELHRLLRELRAAAQDRDRDRQHSLAHQLYGLCGYHEQASLLATAQAILQDARNHDPALAGRLDEFERLLRELR